MNSSAAPIQIDLLHEQDFALATLTVRPTACEVVHAGNVQRIEPRAMQVLIALSQAEGAVVSRDTLIARCWEGVVVGEDAIQRAVGRVRKLADGGAFTIETIPKIGYRLRASSAPVAKHADKEPLLAVLAFDNLSGDPQLDFFSEGVSDEILQTISRALKVIGRGSSFPYRGADKAISKIASELGATHVLDGSIRRGDGMVRISVQLVEAAQQTSIWQAQYDRPVRDLFAVQNEVAVSVAAALNFRLTPTPAGEIDADTYELFLRLRHAILTQVDGQMALADEVTRRAPKFGPAWIEAARTRLTARSAAPSAQERERLHRDGLQLMERAGALLPADDAALTAMRVNLTPWCGAWTACETQLRNALDSAPRAIGLLQTLVDLLNHAGRATDAMFIVRDLYEREPLHARYAVLYAHTLDALGRHQEQISALEAACRRWPTSPWIWHLLVDTASARGRWDVVDRWTSPEHLAELEQPRLVRRAMRAVEIRRDPSAEQRSQLLMRLSTRIDTTGTAPLNTCAFAAELCDIEEVYALIERASFRNLTDPIQGFGDSDAVALFAGYARRLRDDPRFVKLCARLGLVRHWIETDRWPDCARMARYDFRAHAQALIETPIG